MHMTVKDIRNTFKQLLEEEKFITDKSGVKTIELINATFIADEPIIFGSENQEYIERELQWYLSQSLNVYDIPPPVPAIWKAVADKNGMINSNYGNLIFSTTNFSQYESAKNEIIKNKDSRRSIMIYTRPSMQVEYNALGKSDFCCTNTVQLFIRNNKLIYIVSMRSNDSVFGYKNDYAWHKWVYEKLYSELLDTYPDLEKDHIQWNAGSLHVYERHFNFVREA